MIKLNKQGIPITKITPKLGPFISVYQCVNVKEQFLKKIKSAIPMKIWMIRKQNSFIPDKEKVLVVWIVIVYGERCQICDLWRRFSFRTRDQAWSLKNFCVAEFY